MSWLRPGLCLLILSDMWALQMEEASQLQDRAPMGGLEQELALRVIQHLAVGRAEISVSLSSISLALLSPGQLLQGLALREGCQALLISVPLFQTSLLPDAAAR